MSLSLFPIQEQAIEAVSAAFRAGHKRVMLCAPCGFGKSEVGVAMLAKTRERGKRGVFATDRVSLCTQISERFDKYSLPHGIIQANHWRFRPEEHIQAVTVQTVGKRRWPDAELLMVDEAHVLAGTVRDKLSERQGYAVGLSATPVTKGLGKYFDVVINAATMNQMIEMGRAVPLEIYSYKQPDMTGVKAAQTGEWNNRQTEERVLQVVGNVVEKYLADGAGRKFLCFAWNIKHAEELQRQFLAAGVNVATYTANDDPEDKAEVVQEFKSNGPLRGLISVVALTRGFDQTDVELLIDAHPFRNAWWEYVQMLGRVMRSHPGKTKATIFDHSGNYLAFWLQVEQLFEHGVQELDDGKPKPKDTTAEKQPADPIKCPGCAVMHKPAPHCPRCGHTYQTKAAVEHIPGTLNELIKGGYQKELTQQLYPQVIDYVLKHPKVGSDPAKRAYGLYMGLTNGVKPLQSFASVRPLPCTPEVSNRIRARLIRHAKGLEKARRNDASRGASA